MDEASSSLRSLAGLLDRFGADHSPFTAGPALPRGEAVRSVRPEAAGEVDYLETTRTGVPRHPVRRALRAAYGD